ncbi:ATP-binding protein [Bifidobacterium cebidarum]|uniref:GHKL domain-containing protein n=1 Tax=Bifidobacterium cebidarum TaxID=2650773 RepID=A0A6I1GH72_9BIFI|nr:ATP-binding protein [Bifidobacterium cebidarum]KAB7788719.1 GHKL domain-containing protein [Bifidobacterium cebidarum]
MSLVTIELFFGMLVFCAQVTWRKPWYLPLAAAAAFAYDWMYFPLIGTIDSGPVSALTITCKSLYYLGSFALMVVALRCCAYITWLEALVIAVAGYAVQHLSYNVFALMMNVLDVHHVSLHINSTVVHIALFALVCLAIYAVIGRRIAIDEHKIRARYGWVVACVAAMVLMVVFSMVFVQRKPMAVQTVGFLYDSLCMTLMLMLVLLASTNDQLRSDLIAMQQADRLKAQHYEMAKENIEQINIRCHDIRKLVGSLYADDGRMPTPEMIREVENNIRIYDSMFHTGNDSLDVLLTEKGLYCSRHGIAFTCMADGRSLDFMERSDLYSLFGNILDNALESAQQVEDTGKRVVNLSVQRDGGLLVIHEENYYAAEHAPIFKNGMPMTTKSDKANHGLGTRSIAWQTRKYHGELTMKATDGVFSLGIVIPIPA